MRAWARRRPTAEQNKMRRSGRAGGANGGLEKKSFPNVGKARDRVQWCGFFGSTRKFPSMPKTVGGRVVARLGLFQTHTSE